MINNNTFLTGFICATLLPVIVYVLLTVIFNALESAGYASTEGFSPMFRERTTGIVAIGANAFLMNYFNRRRHTESVRGVVLPTFILTAIWVYYFKDIIFG